ncbi:MAG: zf-HC2 domain-containing protein [Pseudorhodobacter sp.]|nr:zf-HC2 domain-containing protein [Frankiaceae bacterium]
MTSPEDHDDQVADLSAYVLGALSGAERDAVRVHLAGCLVCQRELLDMAPLPGLLNRVRPDPDAVLPTAPPPPVLRERLVNQVVVGRARERRRRVLTAGALASAASLVVGLAVVGANQGGDTGRPGVQAAGPAYVPMALSVPAPGMHAEAGVKNTAWGSAISIQAQGWPTSSVAHIAVRTRTGALLRLGSWGGTGDVVLHCATSTWVHRRDLRELQITSPAGVVEARLSLA